MLVQSLRSIAVLKSHRSSICLWQSRSALESSDCQDFLGYAVDPQSTGLQNTVYRLWQDCEEPEKAVSGIAGRREDCGGPPDEDPGNPPELTQDCLKYGIQSQSSGLQKPKVSIVTGSVRLC